MRNLTIVTGATASGKTKYAIDLAQAQASEIINCDSLQSYKDLQTITAFPSQEEQSLAKHVLFGYLNGQDKTDVISWATKASEAIEQAFNSNTQPILTGGTGFYINTLITGISELPTISEETRAHTAALAQQDFDALCEKVYALDANLKAILPPEKHRQIIRAYEIYLTTGKSIIELHKKPKKMFLDNTHFTLYLVEMNREALYQKINLRFDNMLQNGAVEEVDEFLKKHDIKNLDFINQSIAQFFPVFNAIGAVEIAQHILGACDLEHVKEQACLKSRHYAKRQITWFRNKIPQNVTVKFVKA